MTKQNQNMSIWDQVKETDPAHTKQANVGGQNITSIAGTYMVQKATEVFGPVGKGWGYEILEERFDPTFPIYSAEGEHLCEGLVHTIRLKLWYMDGDSRHDVEHFGHTPYRYMSNAGKFIADQEAPKKSLTDAIKKCLSQLGFCADIFLGEYDLPEYREAMRVKHELKRKEETQEARQEAIDEFTAWVDKETGQYARIPHPNSVNTVFKRHIETLEMKAKGLSMTQDQFNRVKAKFEKARDAKLKEIEESTNATD